MPFPDMPDWFRDEMARLQLSPEEELGGFIAQTLPRFLGTTRERFVARYQPSLRDRATQVFSAAIEAVNVAVQALQRTGESTTLTDAVQTKREVAWELMTLDRDNRELEYLDATPNDVAH